MISASMSDTRQIFHYFQHAKYLNAYVIYLCFKHSEFRDQKIQKNAFLDL